MEPLTNKELIKEINQQLEDSTFENELQLGSVRELLSRFKSLTENRSELVQKCVEAVMNAIETADADTYINSTRIDRIRTALTQVLNPENTRHESAKTGVEEIYQTVRSQAKLAGGYYYDIDWNTVRTALTKLLEK